MSIVSLRTSENIDAGDAVYASGAGLASKGDALNQDRASLVGVALTSGSPGSLIQVISDSVYTSTSTFVPGEIQYLDTTRGKYNTYDVISSGLGLTDAEGLYITHVGHAVTTNKINIEFDTVPGDAFTDATLWADYIFLDTDERRRFAQLSHEYLIEQVQFTGEETLTNSGASVKLSFNHPVKELIWKGVGGGCGKAKLMLNGNDRFAEREQQYFTHVQPYQHHTNIPTDNTINVYSFALKPEEHQPSGTLNMSRIDTAQLKLGGGGADKVNIYAHSYNVLRILSGMGGLAYSN